MKKKIFVITVLVVVGLLTGVIIMGENTSNKTDLGPNKNNLIDEVCRYQAEDKEYDGKGVFWNGETLSLRDDPMDDKKLVGDRFGMYNTDEIVSDDWSVRAKIKDDIESFEQDNDHLYCSGKNWIIEVQKADYQERKRFYSEDKLSLDISEESLPKSFKDRYQESAMYLNFLEVDDNLLVGYVYLLKDFYGHEYEVSYHGTGFLEDIALNASCLGGSFNIVFDIDAWAEEHKPSGE